MKLILSIVRSVVLIVIECLRWLRFVLDSCEFVMSGGNLRRLLYIAPSPLSLHSFACSFARIAFCIRDCRSSFAKLQHFIWNCYTHSSYPPCLILSILLDFIYLPRGGDFFEELQLQQYECCFILASRIHSMQFIVIRVCDSRL